MTQFAPSYYLRAIQGGGNPGTPAYVCRYARYHPAPPKKYLWIPLRYHTFTSKASLNPAAKKNMVWYLGIFFRQTPSTFARADPRSWQNHNFFFHSSGRYDILCPHSCSRLLRKWPHMLEHQPRWLPRALKISSEPLGTWSLLLLLAEFSSFENDHICC